MNKGLVAAGALALVLAAGAAGWWWKGRVDAGAPAVAQNAAQHPAAARDPAQRAAWIKTRIAEHQHLWREADYAEVKRKADAGDALAQRRMSEIHEDCAAYLVTMRHNLDLLRTLVKADPGSKPAVEGIYRDLHRLCPAAIVDLRANPDLANVWLHRSAKSGDLVAEMRFVGRGEQRLSVGQVRYFLNRIRETGDPDAIFEMSLLLSRIDPASAWPDARQAPALQGVAAEQAWALASCRAGFDCLRGSRVMTLVCLTSLSCNSPDYLRYVVASDGCAGQKSAIEQRMAIVEHDLLAPEP